MEKTYTTSNEEIIKKANRAILVGVNFTSNKFDQCSYGSLDELEGLLETAGGSCCGKMLQTKDVPDPATFMGSGKAEELRLLVEQQEAGLIVMDNELSPTQIRNLENYTGARVMDRSMLILDIFAMRAATKEGKLQVELAQLKYMAPRLTASYENLSRLGGGVGTRGPGESKLETDRRRMREKINQLSAELKQVKKNRELQRKQRQKNNIPLVSIIGYTNAGKSTIFNVLTGEHVLAEDKLFATLDTVVRKVEISESCQALVSDTVGFIKKLPHHLVEAFHSTLEEMAYADLLVHVLDASQENWEENERVSYETMEQVGVHGTPVITVFNKCDIANVESLPKRENSVCISAKTGAGMDTLRQMIEQELAKLKKTLTIGIPYDKGYLVDLVHSKGSVLSTSYENEYVKMKCRVDGELYGQVVPYILEEADGADGI